MSLERSGQGVAARSGADPGDHEHGDEADRHHGTPNPHQAHEELFAADAGTCSRVALLASRCRVTLRCSGLTPSGGPVGVRHTGSFGAGSRGSPTATADPVHLFHPVAAGRWAPGSSHRPEPGDHHRCARYWARSQFRSVGPWRSSGEGDLVLEVHTLGEGLVDGTAGGDLGQPRALRLVEVATDRDLAVDAVDVAAVVGFAVRAVIDVDPVMLV